MIRNLSSVPDPQLKVSGPVPGKVSEIEFYTVARNRTKTLIINHLLSDFFNKYVFKSIENPIDH
jgi:hypothetical protein